MMIISVKKSLTVSALAAIMAVSATVPAQAGWDHHTWGHGYAYRGGYARGYYWRHPYGYAYGYGPVIVAAPPVYVGPPQPVYYAPQPYSAAPAYAAYGYGPTLSVNIR